MALGVDVTVTYNVGEQTLDFRVAGLEKPNGFSISVRQRLSVLRATLVLDSLAGHLQADISNASSEAWERFNQVLGSGEQLGAQMTQSKKLANHLHPEDFQNSTFGLSGKAVFDEEYEETSIATLVALMCGAVFELLPIERVYEGHSTFGPKDEVALQFAEEGYASKRTVNQYERSRANRALAIFFHGYTCHVCNFNFEEAFGSAGKGFVEIHHTTPVHAMGGARIVDPRTELVPLCSNCHSMAHRKSPPFSPQELKAILRPPSA